MKKFNRTLSFFLALCMVLNVLCMGSVVASALTITDKPENGTTTEQPFRSNTAGSTNFRIPGIVTLDDGTVIASIDARWSWNADAGGIDTLVSVTKDDGENWTYTFANYLGDNGNVANNQSCCFIDPAIATDGTTAYMIADLYPAGFAINSARYLAQPGSTGFDSNGNLLLRSDSEVGITFGDNGYETGAASAAYGYYLKDGKIYATDGTEVEGYTVDAYFNITGNGVNTNLFFSDSPYKPFPTNFLYLTKSTDGLNWSEPELLNVKAASEQSYLVGPGNGTYDRERGNMVFTAYRHTTGASGTNYECTSLIWMDSNGDWHRSEDCTTSGWSSEASCVVLADGTVRVFYRDGYSYLRYTDMVWSEEENNYVRDEAATEVATTAIKKSGCQLSSILYSEQIGGKDAILISTPANTGSRADGHIYVFLVDEQNNMELVYDYDIAPGSSETFAYSCLTELSDGNIGLLAETTVNPVTYFKIDIDDIVNRENDLRLTWKDVRLLVDTSTTFEDTAGNYAGQDTSDDIASAAVAGKTVELNVAQVLSTGANIDLSDCLYTFDLQDDGNYIISAKTEDDTTVYLNHFGTSESNIPNTTGSNTVAVTNGSFENMFQLTSQVISGSSGSARTLHFHMEVETPYWNRCGSDTSIKCHEYLYRPALAAEEGSAEVPGYVQITDVSQIEDGGTYLIVAKNDTGNYYVLNPSESTNSLGHVAQVIGQQTVGTSEVTITGISAGSTVLQVGFIAYRVTVIDDVIAMRNVSTAASVGEVPQLPTTVRGVLADGTLSGEFEVTWDAVDADSLANVGDVITVNGTAYVMADKNLPVTCTIRVAQEDAAVSVNVARQAGLAQDIASDKQSDNLNSINDGVVSPGEDTSARWTNWNNRTTSPDATLTLTWAEAQKLSQINLYYRTDNCCAHPEDIEFSYSEDGENFQTVAATESALSNVSVSNGNAYNYDLEGEFVNAKILKVKFTQQSGITGNNCVGLYEIETMTYAVPVDYKTSADLNGITAGGVAIENITADTLAYSAASLDGVTATTADNAGITVLPVYEGVVRILTVSEDGSAAKTYEISEGEPEPAVWTVTLKYNDGVSADGTLTVDDGAAIGTLPTPTREGYTFDGWYNGETKVTAETIVEEDMTITAKWSEIPTEATDPTQPSEEPTQPSEEPTEPEAPSYDECQKDEDCPMAKYTDSNVTAWYHDGIHYCIEEGLMNGTSDTTFEPDADTSRGMLVTILYRLEGSPDVSALTEPFDDVTEDQWFYPAVVWAYNEGVVNGTSDTTFEPDASITREQLAAVLYRYDGAEAEGTELEGFADVDKVNDYAVEPMIWAVETGLITGIEENGQMLLAPRPMDDKDPNGNASRAQIATILMRYLEN